MSLAFDMVAKKDCETCAGTGEVHSHNPVCWDCHGGGKVPADIPAFLEANGWTRQAGRLWRNRAICEWDCDPVQAAYLERIKR